MVRNTKGGNKGKKIKRCRTLVSNKIRLAQEGEQYARVTKTFGHGMGEIICNDGITRLLIIRKKFKGRNKRDNNIVIHSIILVGTREWEVVARNKKQKADLLFVYSKDNIVQLKKKTNINRIIFGEEEDTGDIEFDENYEEVPTQPFEEILKPSDKKENDDSWLSEMIDDI